MKFTIFHGLAASLALHSALGLPVVLYSRALPTEEPTLVIELQGVVADSQSEQKVLQEIKEEAKQNEVKPDEAATTKPDEATVAKPAQEAPAVAEMAPRNEQPVTVAENGSESPPPPPTPAQTQSPPTPTQTPSPPAPAAETSSPPAETKAGTAGLNNTSGAEVQQKAQTIKTDREAEVSRLREYAKLLTKKVQANLVYPDEGRQARLQGTATVSFTILASGQIRPETLKIVASSGQPKLDESALKTIRASLPFEPPPKEMTVAIGVGFGRKP
jgi:periplasmic protein TonB